MSDEYVKKHLEMKYFVLKPKGLNIYAKASREAMKTYARVIKDIAPDFAEETVKWVESEEQKAIDLDREMHEKTDPK